jgi:PAS domain-containing protein
LVLDAMREGIQVVDREWRYVYVNAAHAAHGRKTPADLLGRTMLEVYPGIDQTPMFGERTGCMQDRAPRAMPNEFVFPDESRRNFELRIEPCARAEAALARGARATRAGSARPCRWTLRHGSWTLL